MKGSVDMRSVNLIERKFRGMREDGSSMTVVACLHKIGSQKPYFSVTTDRGAAHEEALAAFPELAPLVALHLCDEDGIGMQAVSNLRHHLENGDVDAAMRYARGSSIEDLEALAGRIVLAKPRIRERAAEIEKLLVQESVKRVEMTARNAASFVRHPVEKALGRDLSGPGEFRAFAVELFAKDVAGERLTPRERAAFEALSILLKRTFEDERKVRKGIPSKALAQAKAEIDPVAGFVERFLPAWREEAEAAKAFLALPDVVLENHVAKEDDLSTFEGFAAWAGVGMEVSGKPEIRRVEHGGREYVTRIYDVRLTSGDRHMETSYGIGEAIEKVELQGVLEWMQSVARGTEDTFQNWCREIGANSDSISAKATYDACVTQKADLEVLLGDRFDFFMTRVGHDMPAIRASEVDLEGSAPTPRV